MFLKTPMNFAIKLAQNASKRGEVPVGCVIVDEENKIISFAINSMERLKDPTAHAEILAIRKACHKLKVLKLPKTSLYVTLQPCKMCEAAIIQAGIRNIYFGAYTESFKLFDQKITKYNKNKYLNYFGGIQEKICTNLITSFFKKIR